jgi:hypothetical protein
MAASIMADTSDRAMPVILHIETRSSDLHRLRPADQFLAGKPAIDAADLLAALFI